MAIPTFSAEASLYATTKPYRASGRWPRTESGTTFVLQQQTALCRCPSAGRVFRCCCDVAWASDPCSTYTCAFAGQEWRCSGAGCDRPYCDWV